jgi:phosphohistidine phosphatase
MAPDAAALRHLTLMRHAQAERLAPGADDFDRSLDARGNEEATEMALRCLELRRVPDLLLASPALRTRQTAAIFVRLLELDPQRLRLDPRIYLGGPDPLRAVLGGVTQDLRHVLLIGHNPGIGELARELAPTAGLDEFATAGTCLLRLDCTSWNGLAGGIARDAHYDAPRRHHAR